MKYYIYKYEGELKNGGTKVLYIGKTKNIDNRVKSHYTNSAFGGRYFIVKIYYFEVESKTDADHLEYVLINKYHPRYNKQLKNPNIHTDMKEPKWIFHSERL